MLGWESAFRMAKEIGVEAAMAKAMDDNGKQSEECDGVGLHFGVELHQIPPGLSMAPVTAYFSDADVSQKFLFYGGLFAIHQHPDGALEVRTGWVVVEDPRDRPAKVSRTLAPAGRAAGKAVISKPVLRRKRPAKKHRAETTFT
jgi:hypothetical protein